MDDKPEQFYVTDPKSKVTYLRGFFLGDGGFSRCYKFKNTTTGETFAGKVIPKVPLMESSNKGNTSQEIQIHSGLSHKFVVPLHSYFEDESNIYLILELCRNRSLMEMYERRKTLTVPEVRYFMRQIVLACKYIHDNKVIHRDLTLRNLFLNDNMEIQVGDFGQSCRVAYDGERKMTRTGTPGYLAPEIFTNQGYSYEVDIWSIGCIMYSLLVGYHPFPFDMETSSEIKKFDYFLPPSLDKNARLLIAKLLHPDPNKRPNANSILVDDFMTCGYIPSHLPTSFLMMRPRILDNMLALQEGRADPVDQMEIDCRKVNDVFKDQRTMPKDFYLKKLLLMVMKVIACNRKPKCTGRWKDAEDPHGIPFVWISKYADVPSLSIIGYELCDDCIGIFFNDKTSLVLLQDGERLQYIDENTKEEFFTMKHYPPLINWKVKLLIEFQEEFDENLYKIGVAVRPRNEDQLAHVPYVQAYFLTEEATIFYLSNGTFQADILLSNTKVILCPLMESISLFDENRLLTVYSLKLLAKYGCSPELASTLHFCKAMILELCRPTKNVSLWS